MIWNHVFLISLISGDVSLNDISDMFLPPDIPNISICKNVSKYLAISRSPTSTINEPDRETRLCPITKQISLQQLTQELV